MLQSEFQVTLPSTSSGQFFPLNKASHYNTMLKSPLHLDGEWEVALMDVQYPMNWHNFSGAEVAVICKVKDNGIQAVPFNDISSLHQHRPTIDNSVSCAELRNKAIHFYQQHNIEYSSIVVVKIPAGHYKSTDALMATFAALFNYDDIMADSPGKILATYIPSTKIARLSIENMHFCDIICREPKFLMALGCMPEELGKNFYYSRILGRCKAPSPLPNISTIYVYTDIIKWQRVGDNEAPLLATLPVQGNPEEQVFWSFNPPYYIPLSVNQINTIEIKLATDDGQDLPFENLGKVICRLNFRRRRFNL